MAVVVDPAWETRPVVVTENPTTAGHGGAPRAVVVDPGVRPARMAVVVDPACTRPGRPARWW